MSRLILFPSRPEQGFEILRHGAVQQSPLWTTRCVTPCLSLEGVSQNEGTQRLALEAPVHREGDAANFVPNVTTVELRRIARRGAGQRQPSVAQCQPPP